MVGLPHRRYFPCGVYWRLVGKLKHRRGEFEVKSGYRKGCTVPRQYIAPDQKSLTLGVPGRHSTRRCDLSAGRVHGGPVLSVANWKSDRWKWNPRRMGRRNGQMAGAQILLGSSRHYL